MLENQWRRARIAALLSAGAAGLALELLALAGPVFGVGPLPRLLEPTVPAFLRDNPGVLAGLTGGSLLSLIVGWWVFVLPFRALFPVEEWDWGNALGVVVLVDSTVFVVAFVLGVAYLAERLAG